MQACARCGAGLEAAYYEGARLCAACEPDPMPDLVASLASLGAREVGDRILSHPAGLALAALASAHQQARKEGRAGDWPAIFEHAGRIIRTHRKATP